MGPQLMPFDLGLFDVMQADPLRTLSLREVYQARLDDLELADQLGFSVAFCAERHFTPLCQCPAPGAWLGAASQRTERIRLGVLAYTLPIHEPVLLAEEIAVLDQLTGGRLEVGLGLGHRPEELVVLGVDPGQRIDIFQERLSILEGLWSGGAVSIESSHHLLRDAAIHPLPIQSPHPPLWYAGTDPGAVNWAASRGMSVAVGFRPARDLAQAAAFHAGRADFQAESGPDAPGGRFALMRHAYVADSDEPAFAEMTDDLYRLGARGGVDEGSRAVRKEQAAQAAKRVVAEEVYLAGGPETVATSIQEARASLGIDLFLADVYGAGMDAERIRQTMRNLAGPVRDLLAGAVSAS
jgi:alkanesulfonate monooxygenase SsuD/methylene tetrahydromethanopterin reductase-like flavin-dependent oxidoreductase (luciferase family)